MWIVFIQDPHPADEEHYKTYNTYQSKEKRGYKMGKRTKSKAVNITPEEKEVIPNKEALYVEEYLNKLKKEGYDAVIRDGMITIYEDEITELRMKEINRFMSDYRKSYSVMPKSRKIISD